MLAALGVGLWKLFSGTASDATKIGVAIGAIGYPLGMIGMALMERSENKPPLFLTPLSIYVLALGTSSIFGVIFWRVCISPLSVAGKVGVGAGIIVSLFFIGDLASLILVRHRHARGMASALE